MSTVMGLKIVTVGVGRQLDGSREGGRKKGGEREKWQGGEERRNPGEEEHRYVFVLPVALAPYTFSAGFFSLGTQICFVTYVNAQCQLIYTKAIQPDGIRSPLCQGLSSG